MNNSEVRCYSGHTYAERPRSFEWGGTEYQVEKIEKEWRGPGEKCFRVRTGDNKLFKLCYNEKEEQWSIKEILNTKQIQIPEFRA